MPGNLIDISPGTISAWPEPNYDDPEERTWLPSYAGVFLALATVMVAARLWLRFQGQAGNLGIDDVRGSQFLKGTTSGLTCVDTSLPGMIDWQPFHGNYRTRRPKLPCWTSCMGHPNFQARKSCQSCLAW